MIAPDFGRPCPAVSFNAGAAGRCGVTSACRDLFIDRINAEDGATEHRHERFVVIATAQPEQRRSIVPAANDVGGDAALRRRRNIQPIRTNAPT